MNSLLQIPWIDLLQVDPWTLQHPYGVAASPSTLGEVRPHASTPRPHRGLKRWNTGLLGTSGENVHLRPPASTSSHVEKVRPRRSVRPRHKMLGISPRATACPALPSHGSLTWRRSNPKCASTHFQNHGLGFPPRRRTRERWARSSPAPSQPLGRCHPSPVKGPPSSCLQLVA